MRQVIDDESTISLCMIVRNEERYIGRCLSSVKGFVDQIVVVDTGSTDSTCELARQLGAEVFEYRWIGDFSEARNHSISHATGKWILVLDADETLAERDARRLRKLVSDCRADGLKLTQRTYLQNANFVCATPNPRDYAEGQEYSDCVNVDVIRLFRNDLRIRYIGRVHELVEPVFLSEHLAHQDSGIVIHHFGKVGDPEHLERKKRLYLELGRQKIVDQPENALAHFELGSQYYELEQYADCIPYLEGSFKLNPTFDLALLFIAKAYHSLRRMEDAAGYFQMCLKRFPKNDRVLFDYANFVRDNGNTKAALKLYQKAIVANPTHSLALFNMGVLCAQSGEPDRGMNFIDRAIRMNPDNRTFHENLSRLPLPVSVLPIAVRLLERYVDRFPNSGQCLWGLADMLFKLEEFATALAFADRAVAAEPTRFGALLLQGHANLSLGRVEPAEESYRAVLRLDPVNVDSLMNLAAIAETRGEKTRAASLYLQILGNHPGQTKALLRFAATQNSAGVDHETAAVLERACPSDLRDPQCLLLVGSLLERAGKVDSAKERYRSAARQKPDWAGMIHRKIEQLNISTNNGGTFDVPIGL